MKCVACGADVRYQERQGRKCPKCGQRFVFEPRAGDQLSDAAFKAAIERVSSQHSVKWTEAHLYYEVARRVRPGSRPGAMVLGALGGGCLILGVVLPFLFLVAVGSFTTAAFLWPRAAIRLSRTHFDWMLQRWVEVHGTPPSLIVRRRETGAPQRQTELPRDIAAYSFDRAVITDRPETVDLLLANNFHFENNCAVLCVDGYPERAFDTVRAMLRNNPKLTVFALHDVTVKGCSLAQRLSESREWFKDRARVVDVGLRPGQAGPFRGCWLPHSEQVAANSALTEKERRFLSSYSLELAVIRPEQTIKRLFRGLSSQHAADADGGGGGGDGGGGDGGKTGASTAVVDSDSFSEDASAADGGGDSFG